MTKTKTLYSFGVILFSLSFSSAALAHSGVEHSAGMHSLQHMIITVGLAIMVAGFLFLKRAPKVINETIKQKVTK